MSGGDIRAVIADYGEVMCRPPSAARWARMAAAVGLDPAVFLARYHEHRHAYDRGGLTAARYWAAVAGAEVAGDVLARLCGWDVEIWSDVEPAMVAWMGRVRAAGLKTGLLSNMHPDMAAHVRRSFGWLQGFDCVVLSCEAGMVKPEPAVYERCLALLGVRAPEALFIDDRETNVAAAAEAGLRSARFTSIEGLRTDLAGLGFPVLP
jgi:putative hydrolase of the HAD superfamily